MCMCQSNNNLLPQEAGKLETCGMNDKGQQGHEERSNVLVFSPIQSLPCSANIVQVTAGWDFILALKGNFHFEDFLCSSYFIYNY